LGRRANELAGSGRPGRRGDGLAADRAESGDARAGERLAVRLQAAGRVDEAIGVLKRAAEAGEPQLLQRAAELLQAEGKQPDAGQLLCYGIEPGGQTAAPW